MMDKGESSVGPLSLRGFAFVLTGFALLALALGVL
jgi:hypothetical protein